MFIDTLENLCFECLKNNKIKCDNYIGHIPELRSKLCNHCGSYFRKDDRNGKYYESIITRKTILERHRLFNMIMKRECSYICDDCLLLAQQIVDSLSTRVDYSQQIRDNLSHITNNLNAMYESAMVWFIFKRLFGYIIITLIIANITQFNPYLSAFLIMSIFDIIFDKIFDIIFNSTLCNYIYTLLFILRVICENIRHENILNFIGFVYCVFFISYVVINFMKYYIYVIIKCYKIKINPLKFILICEITYTMEIMRKILRFISLPMKYYILSIRFF